jgi:hypothetical protein
MFIALFVRRFVVLIAPAFLYGQLAKPLPDAKTKTAWNVPRTPDGHPDLQGVWSNASLTPLERPKQLGAKEFYTEEELAALKARPGGTRASDRAPTVEAHYDLSQFGLDSSQFKLAKNLRTSIIVGSDGRVPPLLPERAKVVAARAAYNREHLFDGPENRGLAERCILWGSEGPPMLPVGYNANLQIFQNADHVAILQEMIHDARVIPTNRQPHLSSGVRQWFGDSRGHWEGDTLVVDTTNFNDKTAFRGSTENLHVTERFTLTAQNTILYQFTVEDPAAWAKPWSGEVPMLRTTDRIFEYACHEGNLGMPNILSGARAEEKKQK